MRVILSEAKNLARMCDFLAFARDPSPAKGGVRMTTWLGYLECAYPVDKVLIRFLINCG